MTTPEQRLMAKGRRQILSDYAEGDAALKKRDDEDRIDGSFRYAVDTEGYGALQFFTEEKLVVHPC
jgi:hypothetical protein